MHNIDDDDQDPAQWGDVDVHAICIDQQLQEAEHIVDLIESTSDSGESEDQRPSPEVENRHASGTWEGRTLALVQ